MKADPLAGSYQYLTPEERFRLILAASQRGDEAERERLAKAGPRITLSMEGHAPYAHAFEQLHVMTFLELLESATTYMQALARVKETGDEAEGQADESGASESTDDHADDRLQQSLDEAFAAGFLLRAKSEGWKGFCEQMQVPPFLLWESLPGFNRLKRALALAEEFAFTTDEFLGWLNGLLSISAQKLTGTSAEEVAAEYEEAYRRCVEWWGG
ncbi:MAG: hypothetical protein ABIG44_07940 [Planctomycetota bacterium]